MLTALFDRHARLLTPARQTLLNDVALLWMRLYAAGVMLIAHGWPKLANFTERMHTFRDPIGIGSPASFALATFAEFFCSILVILGLGTRLALTQLIATMTVAVIVTGGNIVGGRESSEFPFLFLGAFVALILLGPGRISLDHLIVKRFRSGTLSE